jgi:hypothetical protein
MLLLLLGLMTAGYFAGVRWLRTPSTRFSHTPAGAVTCPVLPEEDRPPASALGWPPAGARLSTYLDDGFAALDAYLSEEHPA